MYSSRIEEMEFPIPNKIRPLIQATEEETKVMNEQVRKISLHHVIRGKESPYAQELQEYEEQFAADRKIGYRSGNKEVAEYCKVRAFSPYLI